jgi:hypothetical protein
MVQIELPCRNQVQYRDVPDFPGYRIGDDGTVWSCRIFSRWMKDRGAWHRLSPQLRRGYLRVGLQRDGKLHWRSVHRLVLEAFVGPCPPGMQACHANGDRLDNRLANLRWDTPQANCQDKRRHGTVVRGSRQRRAKLREADVPLVRQMRQAGASYGKIAVRFGVARATVIALLKGRTWNHV